MNEVYSAKTSRWILFLSLVSILVLDFYSTGMPFYYLKLLSIGSSTALYSLFLPVIFIFIVFFLFFIVRKFIVYKKDRISPLIIIVALCPLIMTTRSFDIELFKFVIFEIALFMIFLFFLKNNINLQKNNFDVFILSFIVYNAVLMVYTNIAMRFTIESIIELSRIIVFASFFILVISMPFKKKELKILINVLLVISGVISFYGILQFLGLEQDFWKLWQTFWKKLGLQKVMIFIGLDYIQWEEGREVLIFGKKIIRSSSTFAHPNALASYLSMVIPLSVYFMLKARNKIIYILILVLNSVCLITSFSRAGIGAFIIISSLILIFKKVKEKISLKKMIIYTITFILIISLTIFFLITISGENRLVDIQKTGKRMGIYLSTINMIKTHFVFGVGPGNFKIFFDKYKTDELKNMRLKFLRRVTHAHNEYLEILAENGIAGFIIYICILFLFTRTIIKKLWHEKRFYSLTTTLSIGIYSVLLQNIATIELRGYIIPIFFVFISGLILNKEVKAYE